MAVQMCASVMDSDHAKAKLKRLSIKSVSNLISYSWAENTHTHLLLLHTLTQLIWNLYRNKPQHGSLTGTGTHPKSTIPTITFLSLSLSHRSPMIDNVLTENIRAGVPLSHSTSSKPCRSPICFRLMCKPAQGL